MNIMLNTELDNQDYNLSVFWDRTIETQAWPGKCLRTSRIISFSQRLMSLYYVFAPQIFNKKPQKLQATRKMIGLLSGELNDYQKLCTCFF